jgi:hypothetical protein
VQVHDFFHQFAGRLVQGPPWCIINQQMIDTYIKSLCEFDDQRNRWCNLVILITAYLSAIIDSRFKCFQLKLFYNLEVLYIT